MLSVKAYAKINIVLEVLRKRSDGYHDIASIIQTIDICDVLSFVLANDVELICNKPDLNSSDNLAIRAAKLLKEVSHCKQGVTIHLQKKIPVAAGLGGGSSDAAATLLALNKLWGIKYPLSQLHHLASDIGFDVPFFLSGGTALIEGRGDWVTPLPSLSTLCLILLHPNIEVHNKTLNVYASLKAAQFTSGNLAHLVAEQIRRERKISSASYYNVFESVAPHVFPLLEKYRQQLYFSGVPEIHLSGAGPSLFCVMPDYYSTQMVAERLQRAGLEAYVVKTIDNTEQDIYSNEDMDKEENTNYEL